MGIIRIVKTAKEVHKNDIILVKIGKFYQVYGKDAYIISYIFDYKLKKVEEVYMCGFPQDSYNKVIAKLEEKKINYMILDRRNNYEIDEFCDNKNISFILILKEIAKQTRSQLGKKIFMNSNFQILYHQEPCSESETYFHSHNENIQLEVLFWLIHICY